VSLQHDDDVTLSDHSRLCEIVQVLFTCRYINTRGFGRHVISLEDEAFDNLESIATANMLAAAKKKYGASGYHSVRR
jgi:hypothetical protein